MLAFADVVCFFACIYVIFLLDFADVVFELLDSVILFDSLHVFTAYHWNYDPFLLPCDKSFVGAYFYNCPHE